MTKAKRVSKFNLNDVVTVHGKEYMQKQVLEGKVLDISEKKKGGQTIHISPKLLENPLNVMQVNKNGGAVQYLPFQTSIKHTIEREGVPLEVEFQVTAKVTKQSLEAWYNQVTSTDEGHEMDLQTGNTDTDMMAMMQQVIEESRKKDKQIEKLMEMLAK